MLLSTADRFADVVRSHGIKVLLIHGVEDQLVPVSNSRRLAAKLGTSAALIEPLRKRCRRNLSSGSPSLSRSNI